MRVEKPTTRIASWVNLLPVEATANPTVLLQVAEAFSDLPASLAFRVTKGSFEHRVD